MGTMATQITSLTNVYSTVRSKKTAKLRVTGLCAGNSPVTGEFPAEKARNARDVSIWWCHHDNLPLATYGCQATSDNDCWPVMHLRCPKMGFADWQSLPKQNFWVYIILTHGAKWNYRSLNSFTSVYTCIMYIANILKRQRDTSLFQEVLIIAFNYHIFLNAGYILHNLYISETTMKRLGSNFHHLRFQ